MSDPYRRRPNSLCSVCGTPIYRRPIELRRGRVFCSQACYGKGIRKETPCVICGTLILASANKKTCSRACANTHRAGIKYGIGSSRDKVKSQRALKWRLLAERGQKCERCGYVKIEILEVHHKDRNRDNNDLSNLALVCPNCHAEEHYLERSWLGDKKRISTEGCSEW